MRRRMSFVVIFAAVLLAVGARAKASGNGLASNEFLYVYSAEVVSNNGQFHLEYQPDGNLVLYTADNMPYFASNTPGTSVGFTVMQDDGNLVVYDGTDTPIWASGTWGNPGAFLTLSDDGSLNIISGDGSTLLWTTGPSPF
jgi:hypothetical protein